MRLNPTKCPFVVTFGKFLGYLLTQQGIEANPDQIRAVINMPSPKNKKGIHKLDGLVAACSRFSPKSFDRCLPFFTLLKGSKTFNWDESCEAAFQKLKQFLTTPPLLAKLVDGESLLLYLSVSDTAVSAMLVRE